MTYSVRHQIFLSSTYTDLKEERAEVLQAIWELDCIPTGMEAFVASNESQWDVIRRVIDECDYYVLIIGGRYGTVTEDGVSYTEKEFEYAKKVGLPILAFIHSAPETIPLGKSEMEAPSRAKLDAFRSKVMAAYPVGQWSDGKQLGGLVSRALVREIKINPRPGWVRNDGTSPIELMEKINVLTAENQQLRAERAQVVDEDLEGGSDEYSLFGTHKIYDKELGTYRTEWTANVTWDDIFRDVGPVLINEATSDAIEMILARFHVFAQLEEGESHVQNAFPKIEPECFNEVIIQFRALGLIDVGVKKRGVNDRNSYWSITPAGDRHLVSILARRRSA